LFDENKKGCFMKRRLTIPLFLLLSGIPIGAQTPAAGAPVFAISPEDSSVKFFVKASVALTGDFKKWDATLTCPSTDPATCVLDLKVQAESVNTGSGMKDGKLKGKDFFDVKTNPLITFKSTKVEQKGPNAVEIAGDFTIRGVSKHETLNLTFTRDGGGGETKGQMAFDRKEYGMTSGIPFIKIADRVEVNVDLKVKRLSGPALDLKN
jgi:polyisoprenoid-binding protein YceI